VNRNTEKQILSSLEAQPSTTKHNPEAQPSTTKHNPDMRNVEI